jgi:hypothetical protein
MVNNYKIGNGIGNFLNNFDSNDDVIIALESFVASYKEKRTHDHPKIPLSIFSDPTLGVLEAVTKYMKENLGLKFSNIAKFLNRDEGTIWVTYNNAINKRKEKFEILDSQFYVSSNIFSERKLGPLENLVLHLKDDSRLSIHEISKQLNRDYTTIYLSYVNGKKKNE